MIEQDRNALTASTQNVLSPGSGGGMAMGGFPVGEVAPSIRIPISPLSYSASWIKRVEDVVIGIPLLILISPVLLLIALAIKMDSHGPVLFRQPRRGKNCVHFTCYKFRTMRVEDTDHHATEQTRSGDPRVTRVGAFLRRKSLDELPQLFNVIRGHMSLIGPRPHAPGTAVDGVLLETVDHRYLSRYCVKPGITGWAQVNGARGILDSPEKLARRIEFDLHYIENWSMWLDCRILVLTIFSMYDDEAAF